MINKGINMTRGGLMHIRAAHGGQIDMPTQVQNVANQGRFGDTTLVHMNPQEVQGLAAMSGTGLTTNPQTGQPEAFLPFLIPLLGSWLGGTVLTGAAAGGLGGLIGAGGLSAATASAIGSGLATWAQTGDIEKGIYGAMTGMAAGTVMNNLAGTESLLADKVTQVADPLAAQAGGVGAQQQLGDFIGGSGVDFGAIPEVERLALENQFSAINSPTSIDAYATKLGGLDPFIEAKISPDMMSKIGREGYGEAYKAFDPATGGFGGTSIRENVLAGTDPVTGLPATTTDPVSGAVTETGPFMKNYLDEESLASRAWENASLENILETGMEYDAMIPGVLGGVGLENEYFMDAQAAKREEEERKKEKKYAGLVYQEMPPPSSAYYGTNPYWKGAQGGVIRAQEGFGGLPGGLGEGMIDVDMGAFDPTLVPEYQYDPALLEAYQYGEPVDTGLGPYTQYGEPTGPGLGPYTAEPLDTTPYIDINNPDPYAYGEREPTVSTTAIESDLPYIPPVTTVPLEEPTPVVDIPDIDITEYPLSDTVVPEWWVREGYDTLDEAIASNNYLLDEFGNTVMDEYGNPTPMVDDGFPDEGVVDIPDPDIPGPDIPGPDDLITHDGIIIADDWWFGEGYASEDEAAESGNYEVDEYGNIVYDENGNPTRVVYQPDVDPDTGNVWNGTEYVRPTEGTGAYASATWNGTEWELTNPLLGGSELGNWGEEYDEHDIYTIDGDRSSGYLMDIWWVTDTGEIGFTDEGWSRVPKADRSRIFRTQEDAAAMVQAYDQYNTDLASQAGETPPEEPPPEEPPPDEGWDSYDDDWEYNPATGQYRPTDAAAEAALANGYVYDVNLQDWVLAEDSGDDDPDVVDDDDIVATSAFAPDLTQRGYDAKAYAAGMTPEQYQSYLQMIGFMPQEGGESMYDYGGYFGEGYSPEDLARTYGPAAQKAGMTIEEYLTYLDDVSQRGMEGYTGIPKGMPEYEKYGALSEPSYKTSMQAPLGYTGGVDPEWNYFPWSNPPSYKAVQAYDNSQYYYNPSQEEPEHPYLTRAYGGQIKARKAGGGNLAKFGNMNIIDFEDEDDAMRRYVMEDTYRAQEGMALPQGQPQGQPNEDQIIMEAQAAILGEHPNPDAAIQAFIAIFGPEAFEAFRQQVLEGAAGGPVQTQGLLQGAGGGMDDTMMGPIGNTGNQLAASPGEVVLPADYVAMAGDGNTDAGAERIMHGNEPLPSVDEMRQFKYGQEEQPPSMNQYLAWKGGKI